VVEVAATGRATVATEPDETGLRGAPGTPSPDALGTHRLDGACMGTRTPSLPGLEVSEHGIPSSFLRYHRSSRRCSSGENSFHWCGLHGEPSVGIAFSSNSQYTSVLLDCLRHAENKLCSNSVEAATLETSGQSRHTGFNRCTPCNTGPRYTNSMTQRTVIWARHASTCLLHSDKSTA